MYQELSDEELSFISGKPERAVMPDQDIFREISKECLKATELFKKVYGEEGVNFEVSAPCQIQFQHADNISFLGLEVLTFDHFQATAKGGFMCMFSYAESNALAMIKPEWLEEIFGKRGRDMYMWITFSDLHKKALSVSEKKQVKKLKSEYKNEEFGAW